MKMIQSGKVFHCHWNVYLTGPDDLVASICADLDFIVRKVHNLLKTYEVRKLNDVLSMSIVNDCLHYYY